MITPAIYVYILALLLEQKDKVNYITLLPEDPSTATSLDNHHPDFADVLHSEAFVDKQSNVENSPSNSTPSPLFMINTTVGSFQNPALCIGVVIDVTKAM
jgi:hypothetical protein